MLRSHDKYTYDDLVNEEAVPNLGKFFQVLVNFWKLKQQPKPVRKRRKGISVKQACQVELQLIVRVSQANNLPRRLAAEKVSHFQPRSGQSNATTFAPVSTAVASGGYTNPALMQEETVSKRLASTIEYIYKGPALVGSIPSLIGDININLTATAKLRVISELQK